jgi:hypothetical protein
MRSSSIDTFVEAGNEASYKFPLAFRPLGIIPHNCLRKYAEWLAKRLTLIHECLQNIYRGTGIQKTYDPNNNALR